MTLTMDDSNLKNIEDVRIFLNSSSTIKFSGVSRLEKYKWIEKVLERFKYFSLSKKDKGFVRKYIMRMTNFSKAQVTRLIKKKLMEGIIKPDYDNKNGFQVIYTEFDRELLAETDNAHGRLSGPATKHILERQYRVYGDKRFERLKEISPAHIYNLRLTRSYQMKSTTQARTKSVKVNIGIRRKPNPNGKPGYLRVDTVHQGDKGNKKGVYHVNLVDEVTQWEMVASVENINETLMSMVLEETLKCFPFKIHSFHSDNGSEYINKTVAKMLNELLIEQTKSRSNRTNDNALVECKNGSVIRKHMGYWHIEQKYASEINKFYFRYFNRYLNYHRPCGFARVSIDERGIRHRKYETWQTPYERLKSLKNADRYLKPGISFKQLDDISLEYSDNEFAKIMQEAKDKLFRSILEKDCIKIMKKGGLIQKNASESKLAISGSFLD